MVEGLEKLKAVYSEVADTLVKTVEYVMALEKQVAGFDVEKQKLSNRCSQLEAWCTRAEARGRLDGLRFALGRPAFSVEDEIVKQQRFLDQKP